MLDSQVQELFNKAFQTISNNVHTYGYPIDKLNGDPCIRIKDKDDKKVRVNGKYYKKYAISYIKHHCCYPNLIENNGISHICGNPKNQIHSLCIQNSHMRIENQRVNIERRVCTNTLYL